MHVNLCEGFFALKLHQIECLFALNNQRIIAQRECEREHSLFDINALKLIMIYGVLVWSFCWALKASMYH
jgi:hypothetical protein